MKAYQLSKEDIIRKEKNEEKYGCGWVCCICGKPIDKHKEYHMLHMCPDGTLVDDIHDPITDFDECAEMGYFEVGSTCYKKFLKNAKEMTKEEIIKQHQ